jgi:predicted small lipoprotein YifL
MRKLLLLLILAPTLAACGLKGPLYIPAPKPAAAPPATGTSAPAPVDENKGAGAKSP